MKQEKGFYYEVTKEQVVEHRKRTIKEIIQWLHSANVFLSKIQTNEEKLRMEMLKKY